jgi:peptidoglycan/LPS O-acetylase OafA/YrhL
MASLRYRPDIDGLRAVAVLGVVIYHAFPKALPGGFCGVDIFFVISGYLISGILYKGVREGGFSFREFYARRIRRLFPALITVLLLCLGYGYFILLGDEYQQMGKHVAAGTLFIQNIVFWKESGYWDVASTLKPLLHLWSLAVEEQFYIIFPPLLLLFWKKKWPMVPLLWILLLVSLIANLIMSYQSRESDFYLTTYRAWEFLGGSLLAWWHYGKNHEEEAPYGNLLSVLGFILLVLSMIVLKEKEPYPGWRAILPVAGSIMLIAAGRKSWINSRILSHPAVVWIGLISYPLYLFHWPALSFVHIVKGNKPDSIYIWAALCIATLLTTATYYLVEKPIRFSKGTKTVYLLVLGFVVTGIGGVLIWWGYVRPNTPMEVEKVNQALLDRNFYAGLKQHNSPVGYFTTGGSGPQTLFFGDSNMEQYEPRIAALLKNNSGDSRGAIFITCGGIPPIPGYVIPDRKESLKLFPAFQERIREDKRIDRVVIAAQWAGYFKKNNPCTINGISLNDRRSHHEAMSSIGKLIKELVVSGKTVTVVLGVPTGLKLEPRQMIQRSFLGTSYIPLPVMHAQEYLDRTKQTIDFERLTEVAIKNGAQVIDPMNYLCTNGICIFELDGYPIRYNNTHLRPGFVREHLKYLDETVQP